jgi:mannose-1-phosphate guanylyltransferase
MIDQAFLLCAGRATRMHPETLYRPKCLLDVAGRPVLARIFHWLKSHGINRVVMNVSHQYEAVLDYLAHNDFGLHVHVSVEFGDPLGTAGGVRYAWDHLDDQFVVVYGDVITNMDLRSLVDFHEQQRTHVTLASYEASNPRDCGVLALRDESSHLITGLVEKPGPDVPLPSRLVNAGVMVCDKTAFAITPLNVPTDIAKDLIPRTLHLGHTIAHKPLAQDEYLFDIGTRPNYFACCDFMEKKER